MHKFFRIFLTATITFLTFYQMSHADESLSQSEFSPRAYCSSTGGSITETGNDAIYICCYETKQKCIVSNIEKGFSRLINLPEQKRVNLFVEN